jgi:hypothetical protein
MAGRGASLAARLWAALLIGLLHRPFGAARLGVDRAVRLVYLAALDPKAAA